MKINVNQVLKNFNGSVLKEAIPGGGTEEITLGVVCTNAALSFNPQKPVPGTEKIKGYEIARKIYIAKESGEVELTAEEISYLKRYIGELFAPIVVGLVYELLEGKKDE